MSPRTERHARTLDAEGWATVRELLPVAAGEAKVFCRERGVRFDDHELSDVATDATIVAVAKYDESRGVKLKTWTRLQVRFHIKELVRSERSRARMVDRGPSLDSAEAEGASYVDPEPFPDEGAAKMLANETLRDREVIRLKIIDEYTKGEVSSAMGVSPSTVNMIVTRWRRRQHGDYSRFSRVSTSRLLTEDHLAYARKLIGEGVARREVARRVGVAYRTLLNYLGPTRLRRTATPA